MADLHPGIEFAGCRIEAVAARGGMGVVYRATQLGLHRPVALKLIASERAADAGFRERFERESRLTASIDHPNVIPVYGAGEEGGRLYLVMRWVAGTDLQALLREHGRLAPERAAAIVAQVGSALDAAHAAGLVHRDVKPANVLIAGEDHVYLSDFGITRMTGTEARITDSNEWIGTVDFMAPEHLEGGHTDARSDVYALGCVLYAALTGKPPFRRGTVPATILAHLREPPPRPSDTPGVPSAFDAIVARALAKEPSQRYASAGDLGRAALAAVALAPAVAVAEEHSVARGPAAPANGAGAGATVPLGPDQPTALDRTEFLPAASPTRVAPKQPARRLYRSRRGLVALGVLAAGAAAIGVAVAAGDGDNGSPSGPLSPSEVSDTARAFARAYAREDTAAMRRVLAPDVERVAPEDSEQGRVAVLAVYRSQFRAYGVRDYRLQGLEATGGEAGRASARYAVIRSNGPSITGRIVLGVVRRDGEPRIRLIAAEPRT